MPAQFYAQLMETISLRPITLGDLMRYAFYKKERVEKKRVIFEEYPKVKVIGI